MLIDKNASLPALRSKGERRKKDEAGSRVSKSTARLNQTECSHRHSTKNSTFF